MSSILTNQAAILALQNLNATGRSLQMTQDHISTGMRVSTAADNAAYWAIATTMRSDNSALSAVKDALGLGASSVDVASTALTKVNDLLSQMKAKITTAKQPGVDRVKIQGEITQLQSQMKSVADASSFSGQNWLSVTTGAATYSATKGIVASFTRSGTTVSVSTIDVNIANISLFDSTNAGTATGAILDKSVTVGTTANVQISSLDISTLTDSTADQTKLSDFLQGVDNAISSVTAAASTIGSVKSRIMSQQTFISSLMDSLTTGIGQLVDADMNTESTRLQALQVQQQLGVQSLSIANQSTQQIMSLFKG